ncbi:MAG: YccF domain-containing protein [Ruminococcus sp.]|uniref:YccF domain-containing protein n=1 Tax=Ruminococcus sp. TaxID=41978 RepID=UPI0025F2238D|nr:YccF domain-containing protein [Ruminococcus sp.]MCR5601761.1 YccF domain-containing protein [Ruminococcus sp.]
MGCLGNIIWLICGGFISGLSWFCLGLLWCLSIVGIPVGKQCFKFASLSFCPFGKKVEYDGGVVKTSLNIVWLIFGGLLMALQYTVWGILLCITVAGIPFGMQMFKLAKLSLMPLGAKIK